MHVSWFCMVKVARDDDSGSSATPMQGNSQGIFEQFQWTLQEEEGKETDSPDGRWKRD